MDNNMYIGYQGGHGGSGGSGGAIYIQNAETMIFGNLFYSNSTSSGGVGGNGHYGNTAGNGGDGGQGGQGGAIHIAGGTTRFYNNTLYGNTTAASGTGGDGGASAYTPGANGVTPEGAGGGGLCIDGGEVEVANSIIWGNTAAGTDKQILHSSGTLDVQTSDIQDGWQGDTNFDADPLFIDASLGGFKLKDTSPCIGKGSNDFVIEDKFDLDKDEDTKEKLPFDLSGKPRLNGQLVDVGAYEYHAPVCGEYGLSKEHAAESCLKIKSVCSNSTDGQYWLKLQGSAPFQTSCDMTRHKGGWTLVVNILGTSPVHAGNINAAGDLGNSSEAAKLSDSDITKLATEGRWLYECGATKKAFITTDSKNWNSNYSNTESWRMDTNMDGTFNCTANRDGYVFSDFEQCGNDPDHSNYGVNGANGCFHGGSWSQSGMLWAR